MSETKKSLGRRWVCCGQWLCQTANDITACAVSITIFQNRITAMTDSIPKLPGSSLHRCQQNKSITRDFLSSSSSIWCSLILTLGKALENHMDLLKSHRMSCLVAQTQELRNLFGADRAEEVDCAFYFQEESRDSLQNSAHHLQVPWP